MTRQLEQVWEEQRKKRGLKILTAVEFGLVEDVGRAGGEFTGLGLKYNPAECLITVRAFVAGRPQIAYVGAATIGDCLIKVCRDARADKLKWKADKYAKNGT